MIIYEEIVHLRRFMSPARVLFYLGSAIALAAFIYWSDIYGNNFRAHPFSAIGVATFVALEIVPFLITLNELLFPEFCLQIDGEALVLKRGFIRKRIPLDSIVEVRPVPASRVMKTTVLPHLYRSSDFLFLDTKDLPNVKLLLSGGRSQFVATARAEEVAGILHREAERFQRDATLRLIAAH